MSFTFYTGVNKNGFASVFTDEPALLTVVDNSLQNKTLYSAFLPLGKIVSNGFIPGVGENFAHILTKYDALGNVDIENSFDAAGMDLQDITISLPGGPVDMTLSSLFVSDYMYVCSSPQKDTGIATIYTDDPEIINSVDGSLVGLNLVINGIDYGAIADNSFYAGLSSNFDRTIKVFGEDGITFKEFDLGNRPLIRVIVTTTFKWDTLKVESLGVVDKNSKKDFIYTTKVNLDISNYTTDQYSVLYMTRPKAKPGELYAGNIDLYFGKKRIGTVVENHEFILNDDCILPYTNIKTRNWDAGTPLWLYILNDKVDYNSAIVTVSLKSRESYTLVEGVLSVVSTSIAWRNLFNDFESGVSRLFFDNKDLGEITACELVDCVIDSKVLMSMDFNNQVALPAIKFIVNSPNDIGLAFIDTLNTEIVFNKIYQAGIWKSPRKVSLSYQIPMGYGELVDSILYLYNGVVIPGAEDGNIIGKRLLINEQFIGIVTNTTQDKITTAGFDLATQGIIPFEELHTIYGIWRAEITDNKGRAPLCVSTELNLCEWADMPYFILDSDNKYEEPYMYDPMLIKHYPNGLDILTRRDQIQLNQVIQKMHSHVIPKWVEHAHIDPVTNLFTLAESAEEDLNLPIIAKYVTAIGSLNFDYGMGVINAWQEGSYSQIDRDTVKDMGINTWYPVNHNSFQMVNVPGFLENVEFNIALAAPNRVYDKYVMVPTNQATFYGNFKGTVFYPLNAVVAFNGNMYLKLDLGSESYKGRYFEGSPYVTGDVVLLPNNTYMRFAADSFEAYTCPYTPDFGWQLLTNKGILDSTISYIQYDLVTDVTTGGIFVAFSEVSGLPVKGLKNGWNYLVSVDFSIDTIIDYCGEFDINTFYHPNSVVSFDANLYLKIDMQGELFVGNYNVESSYLLGHIVKLANGNYLKLTDSGFVPYANSSNPSVNWQLLNNRGLFEEKAVYIKYDLVLEPNTYDLYFASVDPTGIPCKDVANGWNYLLNKVVTNLTEMLFLGEYTKDVYYPPYTLLRYNNTLITKLHDIYTYKGDTNPETTYEPNDVVKLPNGTYAVYDGNSFTPYTSPDVPSIDWELVTPQNEYAKTKTYNRLDIVTSITNVGTFVATDTLTGDPKRGIDTGWMYVNNYRNYSYSGYLPKAPVARDRRVLRTCSCLEIASLATDIVVIASMLEVCSCSQIELTQSVLLKLAPTDLGKVIYGVNTPRGVIIQDDTTRRLFEPNTNVPTKGRTALVATQVEEKLSAGVTTDISLVIENRPAFEITLSMIKAAIPKRGEK